VSRADETQHHPAERIEALELRIEELSEAIARSRRLATAGRAAAVIGAVLLLGLTMGLLSFTPARVLVALTLLIGGIVLTGSSRSSTDELKRQIALAERERNAAIDALGLVAADD
jgi:hypothetical protein